MEKEVLKNIKSDKGISMENLAQTLSVDKKEIEKDLILLQNKLKVTKNKDGLYMKTEDQFHTVGILKVHPRGYAFVCPEVGEDVFIPKKSIGNCINGDIVLTEIVHVNQRRKEGKIIKCISGMKNAVGTVYEKNGKMYAKLDCANFPFDVALDNIENIVVDHKILISIFPAMIDGERKGKVLEILGHKNDPGMDILSILRETGIRDAFDSEVMTFVENIPSIVTQEVAEAEIKDGRHDLRNEITFTVDSEDAKDFDDAISLKVLENGIYQLGVHIADVSQYVPEGSMLDKEAYERGNSTYLVDRVVPMLPHKLSNGICSLNENVDRLTFSCIIDITPKGKVIGYNITPSIINSKKRMTYRSVNEILEQGKIPDGYEAYDEIIGNMFLLSKALRKQRKRRGAIVFEDTEMKIKVDEKGYPLEIETLRRGEAEKLIEDFMIVANEVVDEYVYYLDKKIINRVHETPDEEKYFEAKNKIEAIGYHLETKMIHGVVDAKTLSVALDKLKGSEEYPAISNAILRAMKKAMYSIDNDGHYALVSPHYCHFTAPIRRYSDLAVHRALKDILKNKSKSEKDYLRLQTKIAEQVSLKEQQSDKCEREVVKMKTAEYMATHIGESFEGIIMEINERGMYVRLKNFITGFISSETLSGFDYQPELYHYKNMNEGFIYSLGRTVSVTLVKSSKEQRIIDFEIEKPKEYCIKR